MWKRRTLFTWTYHSLTILIDTYGMYGAVLIRFRFFTWSHSMVCWMTFNRIGFRVYQVQCLGNGPGSQQLNPIRHTRDCLVQHLSTIAAWVNPEEQMKKLFSLRGSGRIQLQNQKGSGYWCYCLGDCFLNMFEAVRESLDFHTDAGCVWMLK